MGKKGATECVKRQASKWERETNPPASPIIPQRGHNRVVSGGAAGVQWVEAKKLLQDTQQLPTKRVIWPKSQLCYD